jgi:glycogen(starch) synthase
MLSWEYPPLVVGGLGRHVEALARELVAAGHDVRVVTRGEKAEVTSERIDGVQVVRSALEPLAIDFTTESLLAWSQAAEHALVRAALPVVARWRPDVVHAHDWLVAQSAVTLTEVTGARLVTTVHATEAGRHQGWLPRPLNLAIHSVERWLGQRSAAVVTCSEAMRTETTGLFDLSPARVTVVPNGVDAAAWRAQPDTALRGDGPLLVFAGRLVHEKGVGTLLQALPALRRTHPGLRLAVAGTGFIGDELRAEARRLRVARAVSWLGFLDPDDLAPVLAAADAVVVPSHYEPFGIVALEAAAAGAPAAVAEVGGLRDLAAAGVASTSFAARDPRALADAVSALLADPGRARAAERGRQRVLRDYTWAAVAARTAAVYDGVVAGVSVSARPDGP